MPHAKPMRYAHSDGFTDVCYDDIGRYILTCGSDGDVRIWDGIDDDDAISHRCGDRAFAVAYKDKRYFTATDTNTIQAYTFPDGTPDGILTRFTAPANHIILSKSGATLVAGASDFGIKIVDVSNCSQKSCQGHEAPVLSVALDPKEEFLASSSCDGTVRVWQLSDRSQVTSLPLLPKSSDSSLSKTMCRMCWEPKDGKVLYVPVEKEIHVYERGSWKKQFSLKDDSITEHVSVCDISPDGQFLAAGSSDGWICVFNINTKACVDRHKNEKGLSITSLAWNPKNNQELVFCDNQGQLGLLTDISQDSSSEKESSSNKVGAGVFDDEDDDFLIQATNDEDDSDADDTVTKTAKPIFSDDDADSLADLIKPTDDDASSVTSDKPKPVPRPEVRVEGYKPTPMQRAFQSASTPEHLSSRFMVWNGVGIVRQYNNDEENSVDIEFHDKSVHHAMHISNNFNYTMADLSTEACVLAAEGDSDGNSKLTCMHFSSWDNNKEWSLSMPDNEEIQSVTLGEGWVAVATDARNVRLYTVAGVQREVMSVPGPVVCMSAHMSHLMVVYHKAMGIPGDQCLGVSVVDVKDWRRDVYEESLPLSSKATLSWLGFSAEGTPSYMDSVGIIRMLNRSAARTWIQIANTKHHAKGKSDHYWIVGIHENPQQIRCIPCKGARYPPVLPRPAVTVLPFQIPLCELNTEKSQYEELLWRTNVLTNHFEHWNKQGFEYDESVKTEAQRPSQEALMKLFALSARSEREVRALEVCDMMKEQHTLQLAIKYSSRMRYLQLAERISELAVRKSEEEEVMTAARYEEEEAPRVYRRPAYQREEGEEEVEVEAEMETEQADDEEEEEEDKQSGPMLNVKGKEDKQEKTVNPFKSRSNPFKKASSQSSPAFTKGTQVFDSMTKKKEKAAPVLLLPKNSKKGNQQPKLLLKKKDSKATKKETSSLPPTQKAPTAFDLWLAESQDTLRESQPDVDAEDDFHKFAAEQFRSLPREEKQEWLKKAKDQGEKSKENKDKDSGDKKRKRDDGEEEEEVVKKHKDTDIDNKKAPLAQSTNAKLANFAFSKADS